MTTSQKGAIAETGIIHQAVRLGLVVWRPVVEGTRYDLIFEVGARFLRIQCKSASKQDGALVIRCCSNRRTREGLRRRTYDAADVDAIVAYSSELGRSYVLAPEHFAGRFCVHLRLDRPRNNQSRGIRLAHEHEMESLDWESFMGP